MTVALYLLLLGSYLLTVESSREKLPEPMKVVIDETLPSLTGGLELAEMNKQFLEKHTDSLEHMISGLYQDSDTACYLTC